MKMNRRKFIAASAVTLAGSLSASVTGQGAAKNRSARPRSLKINDHKVLALLSQMTLEEKIGRMSALLPVLEKNMSMLAKEEVLDLLKEHRNEIKNLNLRTLQKAIRIRKAYENQFDPNGEPIWRELALFAILS